MQLTTRNIGQAASALSLVLGLAAYGDVGLGADEMESKAIRVDDPAGEPLQVALEPAQDSFQVNEPIRFRIRGNKSFFLYLFSVNEDGDATLILPTEEGQMHNKYPADTTLPVPNEDAADFLSDRAGRENVVMVASTKYLPVKSGWFRDGADSYVGRAEDMEKEFADKGIRIGGDRTRDANVFVKRLAVRIRGEEDDGERMVSNVWLTTAGNRAEYAMGESIEAVFGSAEDGWVQLYVVEPSARRSLLKTVEVEKGQAYTLKAVAEDPAGKHAFVAAYSKTEPDGAALGGDGGKAILDAAPKGVRLAEDEAVPLAVYRFRIEE